MVATIESVDPHALPAAGLPRARFPVRSFAAALVLLGLAMLAGCLAGSTAISPRDVGHVLAAHLLRTGTPSAALDAIVWQIRVPRVLLAALVGAALAGSGTAYQGVFRNPLAEPYLLGVAAGAGLGATAVLISPLYGDWHGITLVTPAAFLGALLAVGLAYVAGRTAGGSGSGTLILAGVAIAALCNAVTAFLYMYNETRIIAVYSWLMGGFNQASWARVGVLACYILPALAVMSACGRTLNVLLLEDDQARFLGLRVERARLGVLVAASLAAAAAVSVSGLIGFIGLVVPHVVRLIVGPDHRRVLPLSFVAGAALLLLADAAARTVLRPTEVPVGIITAALGGPFFLMLLRRSGRHLR